LGRADINAQQGLEDLNGTGIGEAIRPNQERLLPDDTRPKIIGKMQDALACGMVDIIGEPKPARQADKIIVRGSPINVKPVQTGELVQTHVFTYIVLPLPNQDDEAPPFRSLADN